jgi:hypothetical protein
MRQIGVIAAALLALSAACRKPKPREVDVSEAGDIPREIAVQRLRELLPTAEEVVCSKPKDSLKKDEIKGWTVGEESFEIVRVRGEPLALRYSEVTKVDLAQVGRTFMARLFTAQQPAAGTDHYRFVWRAEEIAKRVVELFESLRRR